MSSEERMKKYLVLVPFANGHQQNTYHSKNITIHESFDTLKKAEAYQKRMPYQYAIIVQVKAFFGNKGQKVNVRPQSLDF